MINYEHIGGVILVGMVAASIFAVGMMAALLIWG